MGATLVHYRDTPRMTKLLVQFRARSDDSFYWHVLKAYIHIIFLANDRDSYGFHLSHKELQETGTTTIILEATLLVRCYSYLPTIQH